MSEPNEKTEPEQEGPEDQAATATSETPENIATAPPTGRHAAVPAAPEGYEPALDPAYRPKKFNPDGSPRTGRRAAVPAAAPGYEPALGYTPAAGSDSAGGDDPVDGSTTASGKGSAKPGKDPGIPALPDGTTVPGWMPTGSAAAIPGRGLAQPGAGQSDSVQSDSLQSGPETKARKRLGLPLKITVAAAALVAIALVIWWIVALNQPSQDEPGAAPSNSGEQISTLNAQKGQCFRDYSSASNAQLLLVDCTSEHSAQLVNVFYYQKDDAFPGATAFQDKGRELCRATPLLEESDLEGLKQRYAFPSQKSWDAGDRRVDCIMFTEAGNTLTKSLID